jgi:hypothetical protein
MSQAMETAFQMQREAMKTFEAAWRTAPPMNSA